MEFREIRFGSPQYDAARALREAVLRRPLGLALSADDLAGEEGQLHFGLFAEDGNLVACVTAAPIAPGEAKVRQTAVAPQYQGTGVGRQLIRQLESNLAARGFVRLSMHARVDALGFYEKLGYAVQGDAFIEVTIPHRRMRKTLVR